MHLLAISYFRRHDESDDRLFYERRPRHAAASADALRLVERIVESHVPLGGRYLDLMAGSQTYVPDGVQPQAIAGIGIDAADMARNARLSGATVVDLNRHTELPFPDNSFDCVICASGVQYLVSPVQVFSSVHRVLGIRGCSSCYIPTRIFHKKRWQSGAP